MGANGYELFFCDANMNIFFSKLQAWYKKNARDLPWRKTQNPYQIWISEVILQQTRVAQGLDYYYKFIHTFPTIADLARAPEAKVLKAWQGLGYYSRARNMHAAARLVMEKHGGTFPSAYAEECSVMTYGMSAIWCSRCARKAA